MWAGQITKPFPPGWTPKAATIQAQIFLKKIVQITPKNLKKIILSIKKLKKIEHFCHFSWQYHIAEKNFWLHQAGVRPPAGGKQSHKEIYVFAAAHTAALSQAGRRQQKECLMVKQLSNKKMSTLGFVRSTLNKNAKTPQLREPHWKQWRVTKRGTLTWKKSCTKINQEYNFRNLRVKLCQHETFWGPVEKIDKNQKKSCPKQCFLAFF